MHAEVPVDFLKLVSLSPTLRKTLQEHPDLTWKMDVERIKNKRTGEISTTTIKEVDGIRFEFHDIKIEIHIKPHYLYNGDKHNANDFDVINCIKTLKTFLRRFDLNPSELFIINLEYGVNLPTPFEVCMLIESLEYHSKNKFHTDKDYPFCKRSASIGANREFSNYKLIKAYAKSIQFPEHVNVFRFEVRSRKSRFINKLGIYTLSDLMVQEKYSRFKTSLVEEFDKVLFLDRQLDMSVFNASERACLLSYSSPYSWEDYKRQHRNTFSNHKRRYEALALRSSNGLKNTLTQVLQEKLLQLFPG